MKKLLLVVAVLFSVSAVSNAQVGRNENATLKDEKRKVAAGVRNGTIDKAEAKRIRKEAKDVQRAKRRACGNDGVVTPKEKRRIAVQDAQLDRTIRKSRRG